MGVFDSAMSKVFLKTEQTTEYIDSAMTEVCVRKGVDDGYDGRIDSTMTKPSVKTKETL